MNIEVTRWKDMGWIFGTVYEPVEGSFKHDIDSSFSIKGQEFLQWLNDWEFPNENSVPQNELLILKITWSTTKNGNSYYRLCLSIQGSSMLRCGYHKT